MMLPIRNSLLRHAATCLRATSPLKTSSPLSSHSTLLRRLASTLAILEQRDGKLNVSSLASISAAQKLGG